MRWINAVTDVIEGRSEKRKLLIIAPPGTAKSTWLSIAVPCWCLGNHPEQPLMFLTSSDVNAYQFGNTVRDTCENNPRHIATFPDKRARPNPSRGWSSSSGLYFGGTPDNAKDPSYRAAGWGSSTIGARATGIIIDDPLTQQQAESPIEQENAKRYYKMTVETRLHPTEGWIIAIMTRWHENDLAAFFMEQSDWAVLTTPAILDIDTPRQRSIWPARFPLEFFLTKQKEDPATFACVYLNDPRALGGQIFKTSAWFKPIPEAMRVPDKDGRAPLSRLNRIQYWDLAWSKNDTADYTASVTMSFDKDYNGYVTHVWHGRFDVPVAKAEADVVLPTTGQRTLDDEIVDQIVAHRPQMVGIEIGAYKQAATRDLIKRVMKALTKKNIAIPIIGITQTRDKILNAHLPAGRAENGLIYVDREAAWYPLFENECLGFPRGKHDDIVDAFSGACQLGIERIKQTPAKPGEYQIKKAEPERSWLDKAFEDGDVRVTRTSWRG